MSDITFVCCIEAGGLEELTIRMISSLRRWGGKFRNADIIAVKPRKGARLTHETLKFLEFNSVKFISSNANTESWFKYMNKPHALKLAEKHITTEYTCWIDSDIIILKEPFTSAEYNQYDVSACASDKNIGSSGVNDMFEPYWGRLCEELGIDLRHDMPWIVTRDERQDKIRLYFNSGVFLYKSGIGFPKRYLGVCQKLLFSKISNPESGLFFTDQVALGLVVCLMRLSYCELPLSDNFPINSKKIKRNDVLSGDVAVLHYHDMMWPKHWEAVLTIVGNRNDEALEWLKELGPMVNNSSFFNKVVASVFSNFREWKLSRFLKRCEIVR